MICPLSNCPDEFFRQFDYKAIVNHSFPMGQAFDYFFVELRDVEMLIMREPIKIMTALPMVQSVSLYAAVDSV